MTQSHKFKENNAFAVLLLLTLLMCPSVSYSFPIYTCVGASDVGNTTFAQNLNTVNVYIQDDIDDEFNFCSINEDLDSEWQGISIINTALETWNAESRGMAFRYRGLYTNPTNAPEEIANAFCTDNSIPDGSVLVWVTRRCAPDGLGGCRTGGGANGPTASAQVCVNDSDKATITFWGDRQLSAPDWDEDCLPNQGHPLYIDTNNTAAIVNGVAGYRDFQAIVMHELGHIIGHDHPATNAAGVGAENRSVMLQTNGFTGNSQNFFNSRHLFPYDTECAEDYRPSKRSQYYWAEWETMGPYFTSVITTSTRDTTKSSVSGGRTRFSGFDHSWGAYIQLNNNSPTVMRDYMYQGLPTPTYNSTFDFSYTSTNLFGTWLDQLHHRPVFYSPLERSGSRNLSRVTFANRETTLTGLNFEDIMPPRLMYLRTDNVFGPSSTNTAKGTYYACRNPACTGNIPNIQSSIPLVSAWDPVSSNTIFVHVNTDPTSFTDNGKITVHPGFNTTSTNNTLRSGSTLWFAPNRPTATPFDYNMETDVMPGVACSPISHTGFPFNCMLAWVDRGAPNARILYTYFRVNGTTVEWDDQIERRVGANSAAGVSLAYIPDTGSQPSDLSKPNFFMAFKGMASSNRGDIVVMHKNDDAGTPYTGWTTININRDDVQSPPTWIYRNETTGQDALLYWTEQF